MVQKENLCSQRKRKEESKKIYFNFVNARKYLREDRETWERGVSVTNRNVLSVERHMELLNLNDEAMHIPI